MNQKHSISLRAIYQINRQLSFLHGTLKDRCFAWYQRFRTFTILTLVLTLAIPAPCVGETKRLFRIGTGGLTGVYYPIGKLIAQGLTGSAEAKDATETGEYGVPGYIGVAQNSAGSIENVRAVASGEIEAGLVQADVASWAYHADRVFTGNENVRVVRAVAGLYPEKLQIVTRRDADIHRMLDLRGKRISVDEAGSGTLAVMQIVLEAHGISEKDLLPVYLKPVFTHDKMVNGELQGFVMMAGTPMKAVTQLSDIGISLVPIVPEMALRIRARFPYLVPGKIPAGVYQGIPETPTLEVHALFVVSSAMEENLAYQTTAALWSERTRSILKHGHPQGKSVTPETALAGISIPLHPGAERFYREKGMLPKGAQ